MNVSELEGIIIRKSGLSGSSASSLCQDSLSSILALLSSGRDAVFPGLGVLELKDFPGRRTVFFKPDSGCSIEENVPGFLFYSTVLDVLSGGSEVSFPELGTFRPVESNGSIRITFIPSTGLRNLLNGSLSSTSSLSNDVSSSLSSRSGQLSGVKSPVPAAGDRISPVSRKVEIKAETKADANTDIAPSLSPVSEESLVAEAESVVVPVETTAVPSSSSDVDKNRRKTVSRSARVGDTLVPQDKKVVASMKGKRSLIVPVIAILICLAGFVFIYMLSGHSGTDSSAGESESSSSLRSGSVNLLNLAEKKYGNKAYWVYLYEANRDQLASPLNVSEKIELRIPDLRSEYNIDPRDSSEIVRANLLGEKILKQNR